MIDEGFKRMSFFTGFFTQAKDWQAEQEYHMEKRRLHNQYLHTPGVVYGCLENLNVSTNEEGTFLHISPGYAIDGEGRDLYLPKEERIPINPKKHTPPTIVYVVILHDTDKEEDWREDRANPEYSGYAFIKEYPKVDIATKEPDNHNFIELARIDLSKDAARVMNPKDPNSPGVNEINMKFVKAAGATSPIRLEDLVSVVEDGETRVAPSKDAIPSEDDTSIEIEKIGGKYSFGFYVVSAYPVEDARILWRVESKFGQGKAEYRLFFKNFSEKAVNVRYKIYKLNFG
jgi:hypothetical protein